MKIAVPIFSGDTRLSINTAYLNYVKSANMEPILVNEFNNLQEIAQVCDGLLLPGGIDIEPTWYGEENEASDGCDPERDDFERAVFHAFINNEKKVFGICRGFQLMVREFLNEYKDGCKGLYYCQHINGHSLASSRNARRSTPTHSVSIVTKALYNIPAVEGKKSSRMFVNSMHHQALLAEPHRFSFVIQQNEASFHCIAASDAGISKEMNMAVVEAADMMFHGVTVRGVQWHPEELLDVALLTNYFTGAVADGAKIKLHR